VPRRARLLAGLCGLLLLSPFGARAQEAGRLLAVQQRKFNLTHELMVGGTFEPQDAFSKGLAPELAYIYHLDDAWSWEVLRGGYLAQLATGLRTQLERDFGVSPNALDSLQYYASSSMTWAPLYGKLALRNAAIVHTEAFLNFGGAFGHFTSGGYGAGPEVGVGLRVFVNKVVSVRFDARDALFFQHSRTNVLFLTLGLSFSLGGSDG
jgi:outer membrane beta-barrel protein